MCSRSEMNKSTENYSDSILKAKKLMNDADRLLIGVGSGLSASGGLDYTSPDLAEKWYPEYCRLGKRSIAEIMGSFWVTTISEQNAQSYWGFWAKHIYHIRYETNATKPYLDLFNITKNIPYFICSTNVDGQLEKAGFEKDMIFAPQGDYALFQCQSPCSQDVYNNKEMVATMLDNMISPLEVRKKDVPHCPRCGAFLIPNLRCDFRFVEKPHISNMEKYQTFIDESYGKNLVLLELGVGYNTPVIIRYPFEEIAKAYPNTTLLRINNQDATVPNELSKKSVCIKDDLHRVLSDIVGNVSC